jgi:hypothetical protein
MYASTPLTAAVIASVAATASTMVITLSAHIASRFIVSTLSCSSRSFVIGLFTVR